MNKHDKQAKGDKLNNWLDAGITKVITGLAENSQSRLLALDESEIAGEWYWRWEEGCSVEWNTYEFSDSLEMYKRRCGQWEEHHNGICCVVERVRDKYLMPRVKLFLAELKAHSA